MCKLIKNKFELNLYITVITFVGLHFSAMLSLIVCLIGVNILYTLLVIIGCPYHIIIKQGISVLPLIMTVECPTN